jgi:predicted nucleotidyltransferase
VTSIREESVPDPEQRQGHPAEREKMEGEATVDPATFARVLAESVAVAERSGLPYAVMGGIAASALGRDRWTHDVDLFVRRQDARSLLRRYDEAGFDVEERDEAWLFKAWRDQVMIDLIFEVGADAADPIDFDEEMRARVREVVFEGVRMPVLSPEDLVVIKALVHKEHRARHWFDALGLIRAGGLDWEYLLRRAKQRNPRRVLSLLLYAQSDGLEVPDRVIRTLLTCLELPGDGEYQVARIRERLAKDQRTAELEVEVRLDDGGVVLTGTVATPERREALTEVVADVLPGRPIRNLTTVGPPPAGPRVERLR